LACPRIAAGSLNLLTAIFLSTFIKPYFESFSKDPAFYFLQQAPHISALFPSRMVKFFSFCFLKPHQSLP
jgi:hypothetical protein